MRTREDVMKDLMAEVLDDPGTLDPATRRAAADGATGAVNGLAAKIHGGAYRVTDEDIADVLFNTITRIADSLGWDIPEDAGFEASATMLLSRGYVLQKASPRRVAG